MFNSLSNPRVSVPLMRLLVLALMVSIVIALFLTWDTKASWSFTLKFRGKKLLALVLVGAAVSIATLLFQTVSQNRILTPSIMGFDALYRLLQALLLLSMGVIGYSTINGYVKWGIETSLMVGCMILLYQFLFSGTAKSLQILMLSGIILGLFFNSLTDFVVRVLDPQAFTVFQDSLFATFGTVSPELLRISWFVFAFAFFVLWRYHAQLDVMLLGEASATSLGVDYPKLTRLILMLIAVLVALSTALVGPVYFFGLLVVHLAYRMAGSYEHKYLLPFAALLGMFTLILGEFLLQHVFTLKTRLSIIIEFIGGIFFLALIIRQGKA